MAARLLVFLFSVAAASSFAQDTARVKAGDPAPVIDWSKAVRSPESAKYRPNLAGQYTVLRFLPITPNTQAVERWNDLMTTFGGRPVQLVWIAPESQTEIEPFLRDHPINSWVLADEKREIAHAYGIETGGDAIIDPSGMIAGFTPILQAEQLSGILDGKAVAIPTGADDDRILKLLAGERVRLESEPDHVPTPREAVRPDIAPSYEVHISPSTTKGTDGSSGPGFWTQRGFDLKTIVSMVYGKEASRVILPKTLDTDDKFDFVVVLPKDEDEQTIHQLVQHALEKRFQFSAVAESRPVDVYVLTAIKGKTPPAKTGPDSFGGGFGTTSGIEVSLPPGTPNTPEAIEQAMREMMKHPENLGISNISAGNTTIDDFRQQLEQGLGHPVIDESGLDGVYDLEVRGSAKNTEEFIQMLREQTGLVLTPGTRSVEFLRIVPLTQ
jgi:uncharacterized protein (TIGR03435 family)